jgi:hypothetical protein
MKLVKARADGFVFELGKREKALLLEILGHYPLVPVAHHKLSRAPAPHADPANEKLLGEAMAAHKAEQAGRVRQLAASPDRFAPHGPRLRVSFSHEEMEWLLQVLNDVRVGSWLILGCPDPDEGKLPNVNEDTAQYLYLMELSGHFEFVLLEALAKPGT